MGRFTGGVLALIIVCSLIPLPGTGQHIVDIRVAVYFSTLDDYADELAQALSGSWDVAGVQYRMTATIIDRSDVMGTGDTPLDTFHYDVLAIPGSGRPYIDAMHPVWKDRVVAFVAGGGGFLGVCGGANLASMGFQDPHGPNRVLEMGLLGIANVYVNNQQLEEWQYLWKANWEEGMPPITVTFCHSDNPVFAGWHGHQRSVRYGGGPGMYPAFDDDPLLGPVVPLAVYAEEPMEVAPLHYWEWHGDWTIKANVTTDIRGQYAAVASTYGAGRVVLFSPHPEKPTWFGGHVTEFPVRPHLGPLTWFIYNWTDGVLSEPSYNWWMLQRSVAWLAGMPLPASTPTALPSPVSTGLALHGRQLIPLKYQICLEQMMAGGQPSVCATSPA